MSNSCCKLQFSLYHKIIPHFIYAEEGLFIIHYMGKFDIPKSNFNLIKKKKKTKFKCWNAPLKGTHLLDIKALEQFA